MHTGASRARRAEREVHTVAWHAGREVHTGAWRAGVSGEHDGHNICTDQTGSSCNASFTQFCFYLFIAAGKNMDIFYSPVPACKD